MTDPLLFLFAVTTLLAAPGPTNTLMATSGATVGLVRSLPLLAAVLAGYLIAIALIRLAIGPLIAAYPSLGIGLKLAVTIYLVRMAIRLWRRPLVAAGDARAVTFTNVFVTTLLNPKALIVALTILPPDGWLLAWSAAAFSIIVVVAGAGWSLLGAMLRNVSGNRTALLPKIASDALLAFAGLLVRSMV